MTGTSPKEANHYPKAIAISLALMAGFLVLSFFWLIGSSTPEEVGTGGIIVNYGTSEEGMGTDMMNIDEPSQDPNANGKVPDKVVPNEQPVPNAVPPTSDRDVATQDVEDAPTVTTSKKKSDAPPVEKPEKKEVKPTVNPNALYKGAKNNSTGQGDGTGSKPGNQGDPDGDPMSADYGSGGSGFGTKDLTLANRRYTFRPIIDDDNQVTGIVVVDIKVDRFGNVISAIAGARGSTTLDARLLQKCKEAALSAKFNPLESAPEVQSGKIRFNFKVN